MRSKLIIAAGMPRSGSTWLYNAIRLVLVSSPFIKDNFSCGWIGDWRDIAKKEYMLVKVHEFENEMANEAEFIIYSYRDIRDAMASSLRKFGKIPSIEYADHLILMHEKWINVANTIISYDNILTEKLNIISELAHLFGVHLANPSTIVKDIETLSYESNGTRNHIYHNVNLFHKNHITNGRPGSWVDYLDADLASKIEISHRKWFEKYGFSINAKSGIGVTINDDHE